MISASTPRADGPPSVGVLGIATHLPPEVRGNDWWPADVVAGWTAQRVAAMEALRRAPLPESERERAVVEATLELGADPFEGTVTRHVLAADATAADMEAAAARAALARAGVELADVDLLLVSSAVPEYLLSNSACELHRRLELSPRCLTFEVSASAYSFFAQLALATPMIESGRVRRALLVQSAAPSRLLDPTDPVSIRFGDAASAVVVGAVEAGYGVLGSYHVTDSRHPRNLIASVRGGRWYDGRSVVHVGDPAGTHRVFLESIDNACRAIDQALAAASLAPGDIAFLAIHHATPWSARLVARHAGLARAATIDPFPRTGYVFGTSVPLVLSAAEAEGKLRPGDLTVLIGGGVGMMRGAVAMRWGGRAS